MGKKQKTKTMAAVSVKMGEEPGRGFSFDNCLRFGLCAFEGVVVGS